MFNTKYPIVAVGMNQVSDVNLAIAVSKAGAVPTISTFNYLTNNFNFKLLDSDIKKYCKIRGVCDFILSIDDQLLLENQNIIELIKNFNIKYVEFITSPDIVKKNFSEIDKIINLIKKLETKLILKTVMLPSDPNSIWSNYINSAFDGIIVKGSKGAGRVLENSELSLTDITKICLEKFPGKSIIPCGGVGSASEVKSLVDLGATAIGIGTLFAAAQESSLSDTTKEKIIKSNFSNVGKLNTYDLRQNALIFSNFEQNKLNNTQGLKKGIKTGTEGHVFAGASIDHITEIRSVKEIIEDLCSLL